jgi:hypothetical protein
MSGIIPLFGGYKRQKDLSTASIIRSLRQERDAFASWATDTRTLIKRGADPDLVKALSDKGPQYVHLFATASDKQLAALERIFRQRTNAAGNAAKAAAAAKGGQAGQAAARAMEAGFHPVLQPIIRLPKVAGGGIPGNFRQMATGGVLTEPVMGVGLRSGTQYTLAEQGPEAVVPLKGGGTAAASLAGLRPGGGPQASAPVGRGPGALVVNLHVNVIGQVGEADHIARKIAEPVRRELLRLGPRLGSLWGAYG